ncbi:hypothetical protein GCM10008938_20230 [Deinococcus roseus]|uniref:Uncharacterized protein n=2 Tax=Deinococcus roseus TaxID=392414 RepID=A0ABQ2CYT1_9DEIO|nr:hypothetical protein GCM10008938_20230 [Deinococcus roseus]
MVWFKTLKCHEDSHRSSQALEEGIRKIFVQATSVWQHSSLNWLPASSKGLKAHFHYRGTVVVLENREGQDGEHHLCLESEVAPLQQKADALLEASRTSFSNLSEDLADTLARGILNVFAGNVEQTVRIFLKITGGIPGFLGGMVLHGTCMALGLGTRQQKVEQYFQQQLIRMLRTGGW